VFILMCVCVSLVYIPETPLSVLFSVCKVCAVILDLCLGVLLLSSGTVTELFVCSDKLSVGVLKLLQIGVVTTLLFDIVGTLPGSDVTSLLETLDTSALSRLLHLGLYWLGFILRFAKF